MPTPEEIVTARVAAWLTQKQAAALVQDRERNWQRWETGRNAMHPGLWELFLSKTKRLRAKKD